MSELRDFQMPALGADMEKGTLLEWRVKPGDEVHRGQIVAEVDTAKSAIEIEVFQDGVIEEILVAPGQEVPVGTVLARLIATPAEVSAPPVHVAATPAAPAPEAPPRQAAATAAAPAPEAPPQQAAAAAAVRAPELPRVVPALRSLARELDVDLAAVSGTGPHGRITRADIQREHARSRSTAAPAKQTARVRASPLARRRAAAAGVDLASVTGTGPGGAVRAADIEVGRTAEKPTKRTRPEKKHAPTAARRATSEDGQAAMRAAIGKLMSRAKREIPHYYLASTLDLGDPLAWLARYNADLPVSERLLPIAVLLRATALAAIACPEFNGHFTDDAFHAASGVNLGIPVSLRSGGLVTPVIQAAEKLGLSELNARLRDTATRAKTGKLRGSEIGEPTITVTNLGNQGVEAVFGVIYPPQVALVGFGSIVERPWAVGGLLGVRPVVTATLSADHRVSDGHRGALFLKTIADYLTKPEQL